MEINQKEHIFSDIMIKILGNYENQALHYFAIIATSLIIRETTEEESQQIPTACIAIAKNSPLVSMLYNTKFTDTLNEKQLTFLFFHEIFHIILMSNERARLHNHDPMLVNITHDMVINSTLLEYYPKMVEAPHPGMPIIPPKYKGLRNYESLIEDLSKNAQDSGGIEEYLKKNNNEI